LLQKLTTGAGGRCSLASISTERPQNALSAKVGYLARKNGIPPQEGCAYGKQIIDLRSQRRGTVIEPGKQKEMYEKGRDRYDKIHNDLGSYSEPASYCAVG
jgi:hypothetical protein